ncbi:cytochrome p450 [Lichtheimia corymbifera JMRC:FSU:9682]|uniref:Cytochrome p450 n=1 Tax=Lichtheimia corymbifera JMRC:FSU:9682 TaxID=1263082 RepID=A0A068RLE2_9FUNG|nr:cytochrome p450 [Lichtheimia corymbifera JMRC:FSU:9682]
MDLGDNITKHVKPLSLTAIAAAATAASILGYRYCHSSKKTTAGEYIKIPLAKGWVPYFGHLWTYVFSGAIVGMEMARRNVDMGPILRFDMGPRSWVVVSDPDMVHELLNVHGVSTSCRPHYSYGTRMQSQTHGLTFTDLGSRWKKVRAACKCNMGSTIFSTAVLTIASLVVQCLSPKSESIHLDDIISKEADCLVDRLLSTKEAVSVFKEIQWSALNVNLLVGFGCRTDHPEDPFCEELIDLINTSVEKADPIIDRQEFLPFIMRIFDWWHQTSKTFAWYSTKVRDPIMQKLIRHGLKSDMDCMAKKMHAIKDGKDVDDETVLNTCFDLVVAGTDPTAIALAWAMVLLCNHPEDQKRLQAEIDAFTSVHKRIPTFDEHEHLPLMMSTLKECTRIRTLVPLGLSRRTVSDVVCRGYLIPKDTVICANLFAIHHDPERYPDPHRFVADRFLDKPRTMATLSKARTNERDQFGFGWGRRVCPAIHVAESEMFNILVRLLAQATIEPMQDNNNKPIYPDMNALNYVGVVIIPGEDKMRFVKRKNPLNL